MNMRHNETVLYRLPIRRISSHMYHNLLSSSSMVIVVVDGFNVTALSPVVRDTVKDSVLSTTVSPVMGIITVWFVLPALNVRSMDTVV